MAFRAASLSKKESERESPDSELDWYCLLIGECEDMVARGKERRKPNAQNCILNNNDDLETRRRTRR